MTNPADGAPPAMRLGQWASWVLGAALLVVVIGAVTQRSEERAFVQLLGRARPWWLVLALGLQAATYPAQGAIWRRVGDACQWPLPLGKALQLSLAKLFADQALPSAGLSSSILVARALARAGMPSAAVNASVVLNIASYHLAYVAALVVALALLLAARETNPFVLATAGLFLVFSAGLSAAILGLAGRRSWGRWRDRLGRVAPLRAAVGFLIEADRSLVASGHLLLDAVGLQALIILLDAATMWTLVQAVGADAPASGVFTSFMVASLFRTMGVLPGGLGTFEATSVVTLRLTGLDLPAALSVTLLFRGLSFWLPMLPGYVASRRVVSGATETESRPAPHAYWAMPPVDLAASLGTSPDGLTSVEAAERLRVHGRNELREQHRLRRVDVLVSQCRSPLLLLLVFAALASAASGEWLDAGIVLTIIVVTTGFGYSREYSAQSAVAALRARLTVHASVVREGRTQPLPSAEVVPGDIVLLSAGSLVPADAVVLDATDFFVSESVLTGESFPVQKAPGVVPVTSVVVERTNCVFLGTNVRSGTARCLVVETGPATQFGAIARRLTLRAPDTEFDHGVRRFGYLLTSAMLVMVLLVFVAHVFRGRPPVETLLFAVALAVGLSPELLPAILSLNLARGAQLMARRGVLVRRLNAIENLGSMDVLCTDKTGTLTEGVVELEGAYDPAGAPSRDVLELGAVNAALETGVASPLDEAIAGAWKDHVVEARKVGEIPFDFVRKRVTVVVEAPSGRRLITKGAFHQVLEVCSQRPGGPPLDETDLARLESLYEQWTSQGIRVLAVAVKPIDPRDVYAREDERDMTFAGFLTFLDRPKEGVREAIAELAALGVSVKVITGDSRLVAQHVASLVGLRADRVLTGRQLDELHDEALWRVAEDTDLFVEVDPNQKERIILSLKKMGHVVGFLGDGVNDAPAMHAADTSLSVEQAVDVARAAADFVLLDRGLDVIRRGIEEGRTTFTNTLKYVLITTSANLGNMTSMAVASLFLPFLPLTAGQILLNNFLSDVPAVGIAGDSVDPELVARPRRWDIGFIGRYMLTFGLLSSVFDFMTFGVLLFLFQVPAEEFRTSWFIESLLTELVVALVMRTERPFYRSRPGTVLLASTLVLIVAAFAVPFLPYAGTFGFVPLPASLLAAVAGITVLYVGATELLKRRFYAVGSLAAHRAPPRP